MIRTHTTRTWTCLALLAAVVAGGWALAPAAASDDVAGASHASPPPAHKYAGASKCSSCHKKEAIGNQYGVWEDSKHAKAFETLASEKALRWAKEAGVADPQNDDRCVKCHVAGHGAPAEMLGMKYSREEGVSCEACHGPGWDYRKKKIMIDRELAISKGLVPQSAAVCTTCHNDESPAWNPERYTLPGGGTAGFDYDQAVKAIAHPVPEGYDPTAEGEAD